MCNERDEWGLQDRSKSRVESQWEKHHMRHNRNMDDSSGLHRFRNWHMYDSVTDRVPEIILHPEHPTYLVKLAYQSSFVELCNLAS